METKEKIEKIQEMIKQREQHFNDLEVLNRKGCGAAFYITSCNMRKFNTVFIPELEEIALDLARKRLQEKIKEYDNKINNIGELIIL